MKTTSNSVTGCELLLVTFIVLKLCHVIDWSWWWVLAPLWIPLGLAAVIGIVVLLACLFFGADLKITPNK